MEIYTYEEVWGHNYSVAHFKVNSETSEKIKQWCINIYGDPGVKWNYNSNYGMLRFLSKEDLLFFVLMWKK